MIRLVAAFALVLFAAPCAAQGIRQPPMFPGNPIAEELSKALKDEAGMSAIRSAALAALQAEMQRREAEWAGYACRYAGTCSPPVPEGK